MTEIAVPQAAGLEALTPDQLVAQVVLIQEALSKVMRDGEHYGVIPGTDKPTLLKPGAEKLCLLFRLAPEYVVVREWEGDHMTIQASCRLTHIPSGNFVGAGEAMCSTKETKYAWRTKKRECPACGASEIRRSKWAKGSDPDPGWYCWMKMGGCGAEFASDDPAITSQTEGRITNPDLPDTYNTVTKMGCKRALVAAVLNATAASDIFAQDVEDLDFGKPIEDGHRVSDDDLLNLRVVLDVANTHSELWTEERVVDAATRKYKRPITKLEDLSTTEAHEIQSGANRWLKEQGHTNGDDVEVVEEAEVVDDASS